jgi:hypothetical protein
MSNGEDNHPVKREKGGMFQEFSLQLKLIVRLLADKRVNPLLKLLPVSALVYLFVPDIAPGPIDDALIIWLGGTAFIELCPREVVDEHIANLTKVIEGEWRVMDDDEHPG